MELESSGVFSVDYSDLAKGKVTYSTMESGVPAAQIQPSGADKAAKHLAELIRIARVQDLESGLRN